MMRFIEEKDLALCGLACVLCSEEGCPGCKARGCKESSDCSVYRCVQERGLDGCYQCNAFPCEEKMLQGIRNRAFNRYARQHGKQALLDRLHTNYLSGIVYHKPDGLKGDYDSLSSEDEIIRLIHFSTHDPYAKCPVLETERFTLRLVQIEDAESLLKCYSDPKAQVIFNADKCTSDFCYQTVEEMSECIAFWLIAYSKQAYVRFSIVDKTTKQAIGTIEMFGYNGKYKSDQGVLRLDLPSLYEERPCIKELLALCTASFYTLFDVKRIVTKAIPIATERIAALQATGFVPFDWPDTERNHYWTHALSATEHRHYPE